MVISCWFFKNLPYVLVTNHNADLEILNIFNVLGICVEAPTMLMQIKQNKKLKLP